ncbi:MAG: hypothetical protein J5597_00110 [Spirochaetaceae bacterium]|nr:hypothetical protein [Spirochaetaceae bacterium]
MKQKKFVLILSIIIALGTLSSAALIAYTFHLKQSASLTAFISTENF